MDEFISNLSFIIILLLICRINRLRGEPRIIEKKRKRKTTQCSHQRTMEVATPGASLAVQWTSSLKVTWDKKISLTCNSKCLNIMMLKTSTHSPSSQVCSWAIPLETGITLETSRLPRCTSLQKSSNLLRKFHLNS